MSDETAQLKKQVRALEERVSELEHRNLDLEREIGRRGVKLNCANIALSRAKIAFDEHARHREEAVQDMAHDLRTPLTAIKGAAQNVLDGIAGPLDEGVREYVEIIQGQSARLIGVVNWLLQAVRIAVEPRSLDAGPVDLGRLVEQVALGLRPLAEERNIALTTDAPSAPGCFDGPKLHQVLENLVGNGLKFTDPGGSVHVALSREKETLCIAIRDTGTGMDDEALERIFHRYYRAHPDREGSGLGLLIARELVRLHGGDITVESALGRGSTFTVVLPLSDK